jgi:hypothetical protein
MTLDTVKDLVGRVCTIHQDVVEAVQNYLGESEAKISRPDLVIKALKPDNGGTDSNE